MSQSSDDSSVAVLPFHNICPRSRNERKALGDKDSLEKARLAQREGKEWNDNEQARRLNPVKPLRDSLSYATESERFSTDVAAQDAERRSKERDAQKVPNRPHQDVSIVLFRKKRVLMITKSFLSSSLLITEN